MSPERSDGELQSGSGGRDGGGSSGSSGRGGGGGSGGSSRHVRPLELVGAGTAALAVGAVAGFLGQQAGSAKELAEEGIDPKARLRFLPVAAKALAASTAVCAGLGVLAIGAWKLAGLQYEEVAQVASWDDALALAKQQRQAVQRLFHDALHGSSSGSSESGGSAGGRSGSESKPA